jgi:NAD(P)-dependent dehydrogenase (short-subunit alcohol dehydrogenase family)
LRDIARFHPDLRWLFLGAAQQITDEAVANDIGKLRNLIHLDLQLDLNLRSIVLFYRECVDLLRAAAAEHRSALVVNTSSISGKSGQAWLSVYSATKAAVVAYTTAMNKELNASGVKSVALCPGFVDTDMSEFVKQSIPAEEMLKTSDISEALRFLLRVSPACVVPEIVFQRPGEVF